MSGDWMKVEVALPEKPEVWQIAGILAIDPDAVVGKLFKVWRWFDTHTQSGNALGVSYALVDSISGVSGFAEAMSLCGWLVQDGSTLSLPNFDYHNGKTAKNRALTAKRVAKHTGKANAVTNAPIVSPALPREEKRREEEKRSAAVAADPLEGIDGKVVLDFTALRRAKRAPITQTAIDGIKREAAKAGLTLESALAMCCERGWTGFKAEWLTSSRGQPAPTAPKSRQQL